MYKYSIHQWLFTGIIALFLFACQENKPADIVPSYNIIPLPAEMTKQEGFFEITPDTKIVTAENNEALKGVAAYLQSSLKSTLEIDIETTPTATENSISLGLTDTDLGTEGYALEVASEGITLTANEPAGVFRGMQTLLQLMPEGKPLVSNVKITDQSRFSYRGMHLDVGRHMFPVEFIKEYIDHLAKYKYNTFHWHLTEDQGWRIEIKKYPKLQEVAAYRKETLVGHYSNKPQTYDGERYGGYYTQEEVKEIVAYAAERFITVIPEIELPGHARAALAAYPELSCDGQPVEVATKWGVFEEVYCPTERTFEFLENVFLEVLELFPSKYIHIGGDECPKTAWKNSKYCQDLILEQGLKDEHELQSYFIQRIEKFLNAQGRSIIGWDEILEGGLAPNATVMSWRGMEGGIDAANMGHDVIMTPTSHCYFDYYQSDDPGEPVAIGGYLPLEMVYGFEPVPTDIAPDKKHHILGAQANVWTEYLKTPESVEYMIFPRMLALAEVNWTPEDKRDYTDFTNRLEPHIMQLLAAGVNTANHMFDVKSTVTSGAGSGVGVQLITDSPSPRILYTLDGNAVDEGSPVYSNEIAIENSGTLKAAAYKDDQQVGRGIQIEFNLHKAAGKRIELEHAPAEKYSSGGQGAIINGVLGSDSRYGDKEWLGFLGQDCIATIDLGESQNVNTIDFKFFNGQGQWIYPPKMIEVMISDDGETYSKAGEITEINADDKICNAQLKLESVQGQYLKIHVHRHGIIEEGKQGAGHEAWLFVDEIVVE